MYLRVRGRNIEVYIDDILIKSTSVEGMIADIGETFSTLRRYDLKLNLEKCIFCVRSRRFLGYVAREGAMRPTPSKYKPYKI